MVPLSSKPIEFTAPIKVIENRDAFVSKLGVNEKIVEDFVKSFLGGLIIAVIVFICTSLTTWGFSIWIFTIGGVVFLPAIWPAILALVSGSLLIYLLKRLQRKMSNEKTVVKFFDTPMDKMGIFVSQLVFATLCIFFSNIKDENRFKTICEIMKEWGYSQEFIDQQNKTWLNLDKKQLLEISNFSWSGLRKVKSCRFKKDINPNKIRNILIKLAEDIASNEVNFSENLELIKKL